MPRTAKVVAFSTTPEMADQIDRAAREAGLTRSELLREAVRGYSEAHGWLLAAEAPAAYSTIASDTISLPGLVRVLRFRDEIRRVCQSLGVARLWLFGSAVRDDFEPGRSDYDFLAEWRADAPRQPWAGEYQELRESLAKILGGPVDVGDATAITNPYLKASVDAEKVLIVG